MPGIRRSFLKDKEAKNLLIQASEKLKTDLGQLAMIKSAVEQVEIEHSIIYLVSSKPILARVKEELVPTLGFNEYLATAPRAIVDMGAVPYVCKGANVMRPGIKGFRGSFGRGDFVVVVDERHGKPLAIGEALWDRNEAERISEGIIIRNVHFVGDNLWNLMKRLNA